MNNKKGVAMQLGVSLINVPGIVNSPANTMLNRDLQSPSSPVNMMLKWKVSTHSSSGIFKQFFENSQFFGDIGVVQ